MRTVTVKVSSRSAGHTLIELLVVLILMGVILSVAVPRLPGVVGTDSEREVRAITSFIVRARNAAAFHRIQVEVLWDEESGILRSSLGDSLWIRARLQDLEARPGLTRDARPSPRASYLRLQIDPAGRVVGGPFVVLSPDAVSPGWRVDTDAWTGAIGVRG